MARIRLTMAFETDLLEVSPPQQRLTGNNSKSALHAGLRQDQEELKLLQEALPSSIRGTGVSHEIRFRNLVSKFKMRLCH